MVWVVYKNAYGIIIIQTERRIRMTRKWPTTPWISRIQNSSYSWPFDERSCIMRNVNGNVVKCVWVYMWVGMECAIEKKEKEPTFLSQILLRVHVWLHNPLLRLVLTLHLTQDLYLSFSIRRCWLLCLINTQHVTL